MQTIIMTVGTSLLTNPDKNLEPQRPWVGQKTIGDPQRALAWMKEADLELISADRASGTESLTNTYLRLDPTSNDALILLHSETPDGLECAQILKLFFEQELGQQQVSLVPLPGINYELEGSSLERMAELLKQLAESARGIVTFAATGGFKAQAMIMAVVGSQLGVAVCYIHEQYKSLVYLPYLQPQVQPRIPRSPRFRPRSLPDHPNPKRCQPSPTPQLGQSGKTPARHSLGGSGSIRSTRLRCPQKQRQSLKPQNRRWPPHSVDPPPREPGHPPR